MAETENDPTFVAIPLERAIILGEIATERRRQLRKWGNQRHPDGTGDPIWYDSAIIAKQINDDNASTWLDILYEEVMEAFAETDPVKLREELIQSAAVIVSWVEDLDRRKAADARTE